MLREGNKKNNNKKVKEQNNSKLRNSRIHF